MRQLMVAMGLVAICAALSGQASAPEAASAEMGFSYDPGPDWTIIAVKPSSQSAHPPPALPKRGTACIEVPLTAKRGNPASVIVVVQLPFRCYGQIIAEGELAGFGSGVANGLKTDFDLIDPVFGLYSLGTHHLWIERAKGNPKGHAEPQYTLEIACSLLQHGAACWMTMAADRASLRAFEQGLVRLDGDAATPLVPDTAFDKAPS
jgi:hypothetical protein